MNPNQILPFVTTAIMFAFAGMVIVRYMQRRSMHLLMWSIGLTMFAVGSLTEALSLFGYNDLVFRLWYLCGAVLTAAWIGQVKGVRRLRPWQIVLVRTAAVLVPVAVAVFLAFNVSPPFTGL